MGLKKTRFKPGQQVFAKSQQTNDRFTLITLIKYIPNYEWYAEYIDLDSGKTEKGYFDERDFD